MRQHTLVGPVIVVLIAIFCAQTEAQDPDGSAPPALAETSVDPRFSVTAQPDAPLFVTLVAASWTAPMWSATMRMTNRSGQAILSYELEYLEDYEFASDVWSSDGRSAEGFDSGKESTLQTGGGFREGRRYGKPAGELRAVRVGVRHVTLADGTQWHPPGSNDDRGTRSAATRPN